MSFRTEEKLKINSSKFFELENWIINNGGYKLYPTRIINSIYFDNNEYKMFHNSMEGITPRKKIRLRTYNTKNFFKSDIKIQKEIKITSAEGRFKISHEFTNNIDKIFLGIYDKDYGFCYPVLNVLYERDYYKIKNVRLTVDKNITYKKFIDKNISNLYTNDSFNVAEIKQSSSKFSNIFNKNFPFDRSRFSKYCRGVEFTKYNYCNELF